jgi:ribosomal protein S6
MRNYSVSLIFEPILTEQAVNDMLQQFASFIQDKGGILGEQHIRGKRPLLAPIHKHREGYLAVLSFTLSPEHLTEFKTYCKEQKGLLRFLLAKPAKKAKVKQKKIMYAQPISSSVATNAEKQATESPVSEPVAQPKQASSDEERIDLKDIDKKLEEIFKEPS